jgi:hypothetical protein
LAEYTAFWNAMNKVLPRDTAPTDDPTMRLRARFAPPHGFLLPTIRGVLLEDLGQRQRRVCRLQHRSQPVGPRQNISALFQPVRNARRGASAASASKELIERELNDFVKT